MLAMDILSELGDQRAVDALMDKLKHAEGRLLVVTLIALGKLGDSPAIPAILPFIAHEKRVLRNHASRALEALRNEWCTEDFVPFL